MEDVAESAEEGEVRGGVLVCYGGAEEVGEKGREIRG